MTSEEMLETLNDYGGDAASDFNDESMGWFGWFISDGYLTVTFRQDGSESAVLATWQLVPVMEIRS